MTDLRQLSERFVAAFNRHDLDAIDELTHQDVELIEAPSPPQEYELQVYLQRRRRLAKNGHAPASLMAQR